MSLSVRRVRNLSQPGRHLDAAGLYLQVTPSGAKSWLLRFTLNGRERAMGLGPVRDFTLDEARQRARAARQLLHDGIDPLAERVARRTQRTVAAAKAVTFEEATDQYYEANSGRWKNAKHAAQFLSTLRTYARPIIGKLRSALSTCR